MLTGIDFKNNSGEPLTEEARGDIGWVVDRTGGV